MTETLGIDRSALAHASGAEIRRLVREGGFSSYTAGLAAGYVKANVVVLPVEYAFEFMVFCQRNPQPCPVLEVTDVGDPRIRFLARDADLRTDVPRYRVYRDGQLVDEPTDLHEHWRDDLVGFLLGCSGTFDGPLMEAGVPLRYVEQGTNPPVYTTDVPCMPAGRFEGPLVVSMKALPPDKIVRAVQITSRFPSSHGAPVHIGDPAAIGIDDLDAVDYGEPCRLHPGDVPVFWACGITPEAVAAAAKPSFMITHKGGHMFIGDVRSEATAVL